MEDILTEQTEGDRVLDAYGRRRFLGIASAAAVGLVCNTEEAEAALFGLGNSSSAVKGIPQAWVNAKGLDVNRYAHYVERMKLRNVTPRMVLAPHFKTRGRIRNTLPPKNTWKKMGPTLVIIDKMSRELGAPVKSILSAYRSPRYNRAVHGKSRSYHMSNLAIDIKFHGVSPWRVASVARYLRRKGKFEGGIGRYSSFVHVDTRGFNVDW